MKSGRGCGILSTHSACQQTSTAGGSLCIDNHSNQGHTDQPPALPSYVWSVQRTWVLDDNRRGFTDEGIEDLTAICVAPHRCGHGTGTDEQPSLIGVRGQDM